MVGVNRIKEDGLVLVTKENCMNVTTYRVMGANEVRTYKSTCVYRDVDNANIKVKVKVLFFTFYKYMRVKTIANCVRMFSYKKSLFPWRSTFTGDLAGNRLSIFHKIKKDVDSDLRNVVQRYGSLTHSIFVNHKCVGAFFLCDGVNVHKEFPFCFLREDADLELILPAVFSLSSMQLYGEEADDVGTSD